MFRQLVLGCVYPTASLPGESIFEKHSIETWTCWRCGGTLKGTMQLAQTLPQDLWPL